MSNSIFQRLLRRRVREDEMKEEMEFHREARVADLMARGLDENAARRTAAIEFGSVDHYKEECRASLGYRLWDELRGDLRYASRGIRKSPGFSSAAMMILALAIGVNCIFFTLYNHYVLRPLAVRGFDRNFVVIGRDSAGHRMSGWTPSERLELEASAADKVEGFYSASTVQVLMLEPVHREMMVASVSGKYFSLLGGVPIAGRVLYESDDRQPVAVLSENGLRKLLANSPNAVGSTIRVRSTIFTIVGVVRGDFSGTDPVVPDVWIPAGMRWAVITPAQDPSVEPRVQLSGLLKPGVSFHEAQQLLGATAGRLPRSVESRVATLELRPRNSLVPEGELGSVSVFLFAIFLTVLLIACANLANLYLSRAASRSHEIAMRLSLGASRWRILRQLLTESTLVALLGAGLGLILAWVGNSYAQDYLFARLTNMGISIVPIELDWRVCVYAAGLAMLAGIGFGLFPALEATTASLASSTKLKRTSFMGRIRPKRMRDFLIRAQVAASLVFLIAAGVLVRNIQRLDSIAPGYDLEHVLDIKADRIDRALLDRLEQHDFVAGASSAARVPLYGRLDQLTVNAGGKSTAVFHNLVDERYFGMLGVLVSEGRGFTRQDVESGARIAVVSQMTARKLWPSSNAIGETFEIVGAPLAGVYQVTGIVPDLVSGWFFEGKDSTAVYLPSSPRSGRMTSIMVRVHGNPAIVRAEIRKICADNGTGCEPLSLREVAAMQRFPFQMAASVAGLLGGLALVLTSIGLYGVVSYSVVQRRLEIGVRMSLGASPSRMMRGILIEAWWCVSGGVVVGVLLSLVLSKLAAASVFQVQTFDVRSYVFVPLLLVGLVLASCLPPALRAARVDPMLTLREE